MGINFKITSTDKISKAFVDHKIVDFKAAINYVRQLSYGRNANKNDLTTLFIDNCGTCSTKHALLKQLTIENNVDNVKLILGIFKMNAQNTPPISKTLQQYSVDFIPEAHCYLKIDNQITDATKRNSKGEDFINDLINEIEIMPNQISQFKTEYHKNYLSKWLKLNPHIPYNLNELWIIREQCINDLSEK